MRCITLVVLFSSLFYGFISTASATDRYVPAEYSTIQEAINASVDGDNVFVADGVYTGIGNTNIDLMGKAITVNSINGPESTVIDCNQIGRGFLVVTGEDENTIIEGFKIRNGNTPAWPDGGGGIYCSGSSPAIRFCIFESNFAYFGGGIYFETSASPTIEYCQFIQNSAQYGGALYGKESSTIIRYCEFNLNVANYDGGCLYLYECDPVSLSYSLISNNTAINKSGGGLYDYYSSGTINNCEFIGNIAGGYDGGAINIYDGPLIDGMAIADCFFQNNFAKDDGGAIFTSAGSEPISNCYFDGNSAEDAGGAIYFYIQSESELKNSVFYRNSSPIGGAIYCFWHDTSKPEIKNCTITNNSGGGGIYCASGGMPKIINTILWGNEPQEISGATDPIDVTFSDIQGGYPGVGNIMEDPLFVDPLANNYRLQEDSPCIDKGTLIAALAEDLDGNLRPSGSGYDIGAYEFVSSPAGDFDSDNDVDGSDLFSFAIVFLNNTYPDADLNDDGSITSADIETFSQFFGGL